MQNQFHFCPPKTKKVDHVTQAVRSLDMFLSEIIDFGLTERFKAKIHFWQLPGPLRSSGTAPFTVSRVETKPGEEAFSFYAPKFRIQLPKNSRSDPTLSVLKSGHTISKLCMTSADPCYMNKPVDVNNKMLIGPITWWMRHLCQKRAIFNAIWSYGLHGANVEIRGLI